MGGTSSDMVVIDTSYLAHRARAISGPLKRNGGPPNDIIRGVLSQLIDMAWLITTGSIVVFAWDSPVLSRREVWPEYKIGPRRKSEPTGDEKRARDEFSVQMNALEDALVLSGFKNHLGRKGFEADDVIAALVSWGSASDSVNGVLIVSGDSDLFQLLDHAGIYDPNRHNGNGTIYCADNLRDEWGLTPEQWIQATAISGTHNGIPGVRGVGIKTAVDWVLGRSVTRNQALAIEAADRDGIIRRNVQLIRLPYRNCKLVPGGFNPKPYAPDGDGLRSVAEVFGFRVSDL